MNLCVKMGINLNNENFMNENFIFGEGLPDSEKNRLASGLMKRKKEYQQKIEGEYEKAQEELRFIELINKYIEEEFKEVGIENFSKIDPNQLHIVSRDSYEKLEANEDFIGYVSPMQSVAYINKDAMRNRLEFYKNILHESIHLCSFERNQVVVEDNDLYISNYRTGYLNERDRINENGETHEHFRGLNEGITDLIVEEILKKHRLEIADELKITNQEENQSVNWMRYRTLVKEVIFRISEKQGEEYQTVWKKFERGYFTGEMMHLRDVEDVFGKGSLRILAAAFSEYENKDEIDEKIFEYFDAKTEEEKDDLAKEILKEREFAIYLKRKS